MSHKMLIHNADIDFHPLPTAGIFFACWNYVDQQGWMYFPHTQYTVYDNDTSEIFNSFTWIDVSKNQLHNRTVMEFINNLWGLGTEQEKGCRTGPPSYTA